MHFVSRATGGGSIEMHLRVDLSGMNARNARAYEIVTRLARNTGGGGHRYFMTRCKIRWPSFRQSKTLDRY